MIGPAFPCVTVNDGDLNALDAFGTLLPPQGQASYPGMTLRDYFAAHAMQGLLVSPMSDWPETATETRSISIAAYEIADEMLKVRAAR